MMTGKSKPKYDRKSIIADLKGYFHTRADVLLAFLFGSASRRTIGNESDVDIAVYLAENYSPDSVEELWRDLENLLNHNVDLLILNRDNPTLAWSAIRGIPLLIRDYTFYLEFMLQVSREAEDFQDFIIDLWHLKTVLRGEYR